MQPSLFQSDLLQIFELYLVNKAGEKTWRKRRDNGIVYKVECHFLCLYLSPYLLLDSFGGTLFNYLSQVT